VRELSLRRGSGGAGAHPGGDGLVREVEARAPMEYSVLSERRKIAPRGAAGGGAGATGRNLLRRADGSAEELPAKAQGHLETGDALRIETPGGGGYGASSRASRD
jgi:N-methylhydantoinase B/oxoprolinase/acetone carboxylase alpha subunit